MVSRVVGVAPVCSDRLLGVVAVKFPLAELDWPNKVGLAKKRPVKSRKRFFMGLELLDIQDLTICNSGRLKTNDRFINCRMCIVKYFFLELNRF
jgi:hypothetical protein